MDSGIERKPDLLRIKNSIRNAMVLSVDFLSSRIHTSRIYRSGCPNNVRNTWRFDLKLQMDAFSDQEDVRVVFSSILDDAVPQWNCRTKSLQFHSGTACAQAGKKRARLSYDSNTPEVGARACTCQRPTVTARCTSADSRMHRETASPPNSADVQVCVCVCVCVSVCVREREEGGEEGSKLARERGSEGARKGVREGGREREQSRAERDKDRESEREHRRPRHSSAAATAKTGELSVRLTRRGDAVPGAIPGAAHARELSAPPPVEGHDNY